MSESCGNERCPECKEIYEIEVEIEHLKMVEKTILGPKPSNIEELPSATAQRVADLQPRKRAARAARGEYRGKARIHRLLTPEKRDLALALILERGKRIRHVYLDAPDGGAATWTSEVWLELEYPTIEIAAKEGRLLINTRVVRAIKRAEKKMTNYLNQSKQLVSVGKTSL